MRKINNPVKTTRKGRKSFDSSNASDNRLWEALRLCRKTLADENDVPPFVIFHDATLSEMMERQPGNHEQLLLINGVGESKLKKYGDIFLKVINDHKKKEQQDATDTVGESLSLFRSGMDINTIASQRNLKPSTIYSHLADCIEQGELELGDVIELKQQEINVIHEALLNTDTDSRKLKPVFDALDGIYDYDILRCVQAAVLPS